jgi:hypothetical protein
MEKESKLDCATTPHLAVGHRCREKYLLKFTLMSLKFFEIPPFSILSRVQIMFHFFLFPNLFCFSNNFLFQKLFRLSNIISCLLMLCINVVFAINAFLAINVITIIYLFLSVSIRSPDLWLVCLISSLSFTLSQYLKLWLFMLYYLSSRNQIKIDASEPFESSLIQPQAYKDVGYKL